MPRPEPGLEAIVVQDDDNAFDVVYRLIVVVSKSHRYWTAANALFVVKCFQIQK